MHNVCTKCKEVKVASLFYKDKTRKTGYRSDCKECQAAYRKESAKNPELLNKSRIRKAKWRDRNIYKLHDGREKEYDKQKGMCKICPTKFSGYYDTHIHIDHCHTTGEFRGLLCAHCNRMLGAARDDIEILKQGILYLKGEER